MPDKDLNDFINRLSGKWVAVGGNRWIDSKTAKKVKVIVNELINKKCKIITGGAEGVDHIVMLSCLEYKIPKNSLKIFLPYTIEWQYKHYYKLEGYKKAGLLLNTLTQIKKLYTKSIIENKKQLKNYRQAANYRNTLIIKKADGAIFLKPEGSIGSLDAIRKIKAKKIPFLIFN